VTQVNDVPEISDIVDQEIDEDSDTGALAFTISDVEAAAGELAVWAASDNEGLVPDDNWEFGGSGSARTLTVIPAADSSGTVRITVTVSDGTDTASGSFELTVTPANDVPEISDIVDQEIDEDSDTGALSFTVSDVETAAGDLGVWAASDNENLVPDGNWEFGGSGSARTLTVTPAADSSGTVAITVTVSDGTDTASDVFELTVSPVNDAPVAVADAYEVDEDGALTEVSPGVLDNDRDVEGDELQAALEDSTANGELHLQGDGSFTYSPNLDWNGSESFTYRARDALLFSDPTEVVITVHPVNDAPVAVDDEESTDEDVAVQIGVLANDSDVDRDKLTITNTTIPEHGEVTVNDDGTVTYTPEADYFGLDGLQYTISDGNGESDDAWIRLTVIAVNDPPEFLPIGAKEAREGEELRFVVEATDVDSEDLDYSAGGLPDGSVFDGASAAFAWTPSFTQAGGYEVEFHASDGELADIAEVSITVINVTPWELLEGLIAYVESLDLHRGTENSLVRKLENAIRSLDRGKEETAINQVTAFMHEVAAQRG